MQTYFPYIRYFKLLNNVDMWILFDSIQRLGFRSSKNIMQNEFYCFNYTYQFTFL